MAKKPFSPKTKAKLPGVRNDKAQAPLAQASTPAHGVRAWAFRLASLVLLPALLLLGLEGILRLFGSGYPVRYFLKTDAGYASNDRFGWRFFGPGLSRPSFPAVLPARKEEGTYRIFVLGSSAAQGFPIPAFSFGRILEAMLNDQFPGQRFEVINTGMIAVNSHVVREIARDCARLQPDLFIVYTGNNEVVGPFGPGSALGSYSPSLGLIRASFQAKSTRLGQALSGALRAAGANGKTPQAWGGMAMFVNQQVAWDDPRLETVYRNFSTNLQDICHAGTAAGAKVVLATLSTNVKDCPPLASRHRAALPPTALESWQAAFEQGKRRQEAGDLAGAMDSYERAAGLDDQFAELSFRLGTCLESLGSHDLARQHFLRARDLDALRFRADTRINQAIRNVAARQGSGVSLTDLEQDLQAASPHGLTGSELLYEHVHFTFEGNHAAATSLFKTVQRILPSRITEANPAAAPPSLARCQDLTTYTSYSRYTGAALMAGLMSQPPFAPEYGRPMLAMAKRLQSELTNEATAAFATRYRETLSKRPDDLILRGHFATLETTRKDHASAAQQLRILLDRYPGSAIHRAQYGTSLAALGRDSEAIAQYRINLDRDPADFETRLALAKVHAERGRFPQAIEEYHRVLDQQPQSATAHSALGMIMEKTGDPRKALEHFSAAAQNASGGWILLQKARLLGQLGPRDQAIPAYLAALGNDHPQYAQTLKALDNLLTGPGHAGLQVPDERRALQELAWIYATDSRESVRNGARAVQLAEQALAGAGGTLPVIETLSAAYAENRQFDKAIAFARQGIQMARSIDHPEVVARLEARLRGYEAKKPFHTPGRD